MKCFEEVWLHSLRNRLAEVVNLDGHGVGLCSVYGDVDWSSSTVLDRITNQIRQQLRDPVGVNQRVGLAIDAQGDLLIGCAEAEFVDDSLADMAQIGGLETEIEALP